MTLRDVAVAIDAVARKHGYEHVLDHGGHGIGRQMHEGPFIANVPTEQAGRFTLRPGNTVALEPMRNRRRALTSTSGTAGPWSPPTAPGPRTPSTRSWSPTPAGSR